MAWGPSPPLKPSPRGRGDEGWGVRRGQDEDWVAISTPRSSQRSKRMQHLMRAKFGLSLSNRAVLFGWATLDDLLSAAQTAEASGYFDGVWVGDNLLSKPRAEALVTLSAIAACTQRMRLGTICLASFPLRDPLLLA